MRLALARRGILGGLDLASPQQGWVLAARWAATQTANGDAFHRLSLQYDTSFLAVENDLGYLRRGLIFSSSLPERACSVGRMPRPPITASAAPSTLEANAKAGVQVGKSLPVVVTVSLPCLTPLAAISSSAILLIRAALPRTASTSRQLWRSRWT